MPSHGRCRGGKSYRHAHDDVAARGRSSDTTSQTGGSAVSEERGEQIRKKILAMGKMAKMFRTLREERKHCRAEGSRWWSAAHWRHSARPSGHSYSYPWFPAGKKMDISNENVRSSPATSKLARNISVYPFRQSSFLCCQVVVVDSSPLEHSKTSVHFTLEILFVCICGAFVFGCF